MFRESYQEILDDLRKISSKGPVRSSYSGSNANSKVFRDLLGIPHTEKFYKGYRILSTQQTGGETRTNLFGKTADWGNSKLKSSDEVLEKFGKSDPSGKYERKLFCTVEADIPNSFDLSLKISNHPPLIQEIYHKSQTEKETILTWNTEKLINSLSKLNKVAIVYANSSTRDRVKFFHCDSVEFMCGIKKEAFFQLINDRAISIDHLISRKPDSNRAKEQGPLIKIKRDARPLLYSQWERHILI